MKITRNTLWKIVIAGALAGGLLVATGTHKRIYRSVKLRMVKAGIVDAEPIDHVNMIPRAIELDHFENVILSKEMAQNLRLLDESGQIRSLSEFNSDVIFMNKWATWCAPCVAELPGIQKLYEETSGHAEFLMVTWDTDFDKAKNYKTKHGYTFPIYQVYGFAPEAFKTSSIPVTYIIQQKEGFMYRHQGMRNYDTPEFRDFLKQLNTP